MSLSEIIQQSGLVSVFLDPLHFCEFRVRRFRCGTFTTNLVSHNTKKTPPNAVLPTASESVVFLFCVSGGGASTVFMQNGIGLNPSLPRLFFKLGFQGNTFRVIIITLYYSTTKNMRYIYWILGAFFQLMHFGHPLLEPPEF